MDPRLPHLAWAALVSARLAVCSCGDCRRVGDLLDGWRQAVAASTRAPVEPARVRGWHQLGQTWPTDDVTDAVVRSVLLRSAALEALGYRVEDWP